MSFLRSFRFQVILRVGVLAGLLFVLPAVWDLEGWVLIRFFLLALIVGVLTELIRYVEKTNRDFANFLTAIRHKDFTYSSTREYRGRDFLELKTAFNEIVHSYQNLRAEKESHYQYLQTVVEHVSVALICYSEGGKIELMNQAAKDLVGRPYMSHIHAIHNVNPDLEQTILTMQHGQRRLIRVTIQDQIHSLALQATEFKLQDKQFRLISLQDIRSELDEKEIDAWQQLIRVLTHEMMNSVTPVVSLSKVVNDMLTDSEGQLLPVSDLTNEDADDILQSVRTIENRSKGLMHFVQAYRNLTRVQKANLQTTTVGTLTTDVLKLLSAELQRRDIRVFQEGEEDISLRVDTDLIQQVLINLMRNAMESLEQTDAPVIHLSTGLTNDQRPFIKVRDNGPGLDAEVLDKVFIPFFTTKKKGSGIGLSLSRQIMRQHGGSIHYQLHDAGGVSFILVF